MRDIELLSSIAELSVEFGCDRYVCGGGGNTSAKNADTLWIKPSGIGLAQMRPDSFLPLRRGIIDRLYQAALPADAKEREAAVIGLMAEATPPGSQGRPSVEAPLHNCFPQRFVVHTHPPILNGLACGRDALETAARLFPDAMRVPFVEPGYTLCMAVRKEIQAYAARHGGPPTMLFQVNHGVFVAHDEADGVRRAYRDAMDKVETAVKAAGLEGEPERLPPPSGAKAEETAARARAIMASDAAEAAVSGRFRVPAGPLTPDHIVYCRAWMYSGEMEEKGLRAFRDRHGYWPRVVETPEGTFGFGPNRKTAELALALAWDGALVERYAGAFGGARHLEKGFVDFIENWEVESYRRKQAT